MLIHDYYSRIDPYVVHLTVDTTLKNGRMDIKAYVKYVTAVTHTILCCVLYLFSLLLFISFLCFVVYLLRVLCYLFDTSILLSIRSKLGVPGKSEGTIFTPVQCQIGYYEPERVAGVWREGRGGEGEELFRCCMCLG